MAEFVKLLAQNSPSATTLTDIYTVPVGRSAAISSITVCNTNIEIITFRLSLAIAAEADAIKQYIYFNLPIDAEDTFIATVGLSLSQGDVVRVYSDHSNVAFQIHGVEVG